MKSLYIIAKYQSKYGLILYCCNASDSGSIDFNNVFIQTLYYKGFATVEVGKVYSMQVIKGDNGLTYCFF